MRRFAGGNARGVANERVVLCAAAIQRAGIRSTNRFGIVHNHRRYLYENRFLQWTSS